MAVPQRKFREIVFQLLYSHDLSTPEPGDMVSFMMEELAVSKSTMRSAFSRMEQVRDEIPNLDEKISAFSKEYDLDHIQRVERNIMRLALFEMLEDEGVPPKVALAEGIRLAAKFATPESAQFVNAVLDAVYKEYFPGEKDEEDKNEIFFGKDPED